jgi:IS30 family transposase
MAKSITYDRGKEMSNHQSFTIDTKIAVYFCDPVAAGHKREHQRPHS